MSVPKTVIAAIVSFIADLRCHGASYAEIRLTIASPAAQTAARAWIASMDAVKQAETMAAKLAVRRSADLLRAAWRAELIAD